MPQTQVRVVGSGFTTFNYNGQPIAFLDGFTDRGVAPFGRGGGTGESGGGPGWEAVHPLGSKSPVEIVTGRVLTAGTLALTVRELWNAPVWTQLQGLAGKLDLVSVWEALAAAGGTVTCQMIIRPPGGLPTRGKVYHNCTVVDIDDTETVSIGALSMARNIVIAYTHTTPL